MPLIASLIRYNGFASSPLLGTAPAGAVSGPLGSWACPPLQLANLTASASAVLAAPPLYRGLARPAAHTEIAISDGAVAISDGAVLSSKGLARPAAHMEIAISEDLSAATGAPASDGAVLGRAASTATSTASTETHGGTASSVMLGTASSVVLSVRHPLDEMMPPPTESVALILPTSLCSSEIARSLAAALQEEYTPSEKPSEIASSPPVRFVALPHTEGCGLSDERLGAITLLGHLRSPLVAHALLLEHGCALGTAPECECDGLCAGVGVTCECLLSDCPLSVYPLRAAGVSPVKCHL